MKITNKILSLILIITMLASFSVVSAIADTADASVAFEFSSAEVINGLGYISGRTFSVDTANANSYPVTACLTVGTQTQAHFYLTEHAVSVFGNPQYNYVNVLINNGQDEAREVSIYVAYNSKGKATLQPGWNIVSLPKRNLVNEDNYTYTTGSSLRFAATTLTSGEYYNVDKVWLSAEAVTASAPKLVSVSPSKGFDGMSILDAGLSFKFDREVEAVANSAAFVSENGESVTACVTAAGGTVTFKAADALKRGTKYTFDSGRTVIRTAIGLPYGSKLTSDFSMSNELLSVGDVTAFDSAGAPAAKLPSNDSVKLTASAVNASDSAAAAVIAATFVSESDGTSYTEFAPLTALPAAMTEAVNLNYLSTTVPDGYYLLAMVVDSSATLKPLSANYLKLTSDENTSGTIITNGGAADVSLSEPSLNVDTLTISGMASGAPGSLVPVCVRGKDSGVLKAVLPVSTKADGSFECEYIFDGKQSGWYEISAVAKAAGSNAVKETYYLGDVTKEEIRKAFDSENITADSAAAVIGLYRDGMGIPASFGDAVISHIAQTLCEQKPYASYSDLISMMNTSVTALDAINEASWSTYADILSKYPIILNEDESLSDFESYDAKGKGEVYKIAADSAPFASFVALRQAFAAATDEYTEKLEEQKNESSDSRRPSSGGGGGSVSVGGSAVAELQQQAQSPIADTPGGRAEFTDVSSGHWAYEAIDELASRNIIVGYEDGRFCPDRAVSRAEFVKLITGAFTFAEGEGLKFGDVAEDAWYAGFLARASEAGIVKGIDGKFNPDAAISRQDAALMLYRSLIYKNASLDGSFAFTDQAAISEYALSAVNSMAASGLIAGYADGSFAPKSEITRAETAQLICKAMMFLSGGEL